MADEITLRGPCLTNNLSLPEMIGFGMNECQEERLHGTLSTYLRTVESIIKCAQIEQLIRLQKCSRSRYFWRGCRPSDDTKTDSDQKKDRSNQLDPSTTGLCYGLRKRESCSSWSPPTVVQLLLFVQPNTKKKKMCYFKVILTNNFLSIGYIC